MTEIDSFLDDVKRYLHAPKDERHYNKTALRDRMKWMKQEELMEALKKMNIKELQYVMGCGVPGSANTEAIRIMKQRREEMEKFLERQSKKAAELKDIGEQQIEAESISLNDEINQSEEINESTSEGSGLTKALRAFEKGRERDL